MLLLLKLACCLSIRTNQYVHVPDKEKLGSCLCTMLAKKKMYLVTLCMGKQRKRRGVCGSYAVTPQNAVMLQKIIFTKTSAFWFDIMTCFPAQNLHVHQLHSCYM